MIKEHIETQEMFYNAIVKFVENHRVFLRSSEFKEITECYSETVRKKEYQTIRLMLPRRVGNTFIALKLLKKYRNSVLVCLNNGYFQKNEKRISVSLSKQIFSLASIKYNKTCKIVILDESTCFSEKQIEKIYCNFEKEAIFILLGCN